MGFDLDKIGKMAGFGSIGAGLGGLFGGNENPADAAMPFLNKIPSSLRPYFEPYMNAGKNALDMTQGEYGKLINDPGGRLNQIGQGYHESPGFQFALKQALQGAGHAAAAGGMAGSPQHEQQNMGYATDIANKDYNNWLSQATGLYGQGLGGMSDISHMGFNANKSMADQIAQMLSAQAQLQYAGQANENEGWGNAIGNLAGGIGALAAFSSIELKGKISTPSTAEILENVRELSLDKWKYKDIDQAFLGPYAEEFSERFGIGDGKTINMVDAIGVLFGAIKELDKKLSEIKDKNTKGT